MTPSPYLTATPAPLRPLTERELELLHGGASSSRASRDRVRGSTLEMTQPAMEPEHDWTKRPLTEDELEVLHGGIPDRDHIPGVPPRTPWLKLFVVFALCSAVGFGLAYAAVYYRLV
jgi:hypothetical protein